MFFTIIQFLTFMVAAESSKLPENHDIIRGLTDTIHKLESRVTETETKRDKKMNKMIQENKDLSETIHQLQVNAAITEARREEEVERLQESYNKITDFITRLAEGLAQIEVKTADIELQTEEFAKFKDQKASHQVVSDVGFSAYATGDYHHPNIGETIRFPYIMTNNGGYYDPSESVFTCPLNGLYYFTFNLYSGHLSNGEPTAVHIQRDECM